MCLICEKGYNPDEIIKLTCCSEVTDIPDLLNLEWLVCCRGKVTQISNLPKLEYLNCSYTYITQIPNLPKLEWLYCSGTWITEISVPKGCQVVAHDCPLLDDGNVNKLIKLQKWIRKIILANKMIRLAKSKKFAEIYYSPDCKGGWWAKKELGEWLEEM